MPKSEEAIKREWGGFCGVMVEVTDLEEVAETLRILATNFSSLADEEENLNLDGEIWKERKKDFEELARMGFAAKRKILEYKKSLKPAA